MGYEIKMLIGRKSDLGVKKNRIWFSVYAEIDLCKLGYDSEFGAFIARAFADAETSKESIYFYGIDGNKEVSKDKYGAKLAIAEIQDVYEQVLKASKLEEYRRFKWALALLESMKDDPEGLKVVFFGH